MIVRQQFPRERDCGKAILGVILAIAAAIVRPDAIAQTNDSVSWPVASTEFATEIWSTDNGLPQNTATAVIQTRQGYIWVGTYNGIAQFDGIRFKVFDSANTQGLSNSRITCLHEDPRGVIWVGHDNGQLTRYSDGVFTAMKHASEWGVAPIKAFLEDKQGDLWMLNQLGEALRVRDERIVRPTGSMAENPFVNPYVATDKAGNSYVVRNGVVARFTVDDYSVIDFSDESVRPYYDGIAPSSDGNLWVVGQGKIRKWGGTNWVADVGDYPWTGLTVTTVLETSSGRLLLGTLHTGLFVFDPVTGWSNLSRTNGLPQDWVGSLAEDRENNLWVGTHGGLVLLRDRKVTMHSPPDEWQGRPVLSTMRSQDGAFWAATEGAGVYRFKDGDWTRFGLQNPFVWSVFEDSQKQIWAGTWGGGLFRLEGGSFVPQTNLFVASDPVVAIKEFPVGTMWVGTGSGLTSIRSNVLKRFAHLGGAAAGDVRAIEPGINGEVWIGTQGSGLGLLKNGELKTFLKEDGLAGNFIISLCCETNGTLWIGTLDMGLCRYKDGEFRAITPAQGLPGYIIYHIEDDQLGNLWFNSPRGLFRVKKSQLNACANGQIPTLEVLAYGKAEGMTTLAGTGGFTPSGFRAPDGRLWFSTTRGMAVVAPKSAKANRISPPVWIEDVLVDGEVVALETKTPSRVTGGNTGLKTQRLVVLQPGRRQLDVQFAGLSFTSPERVQFKYRLEGIDSDWTEADTRRRVTYSFLPPGEYLFHVIACNSDALWNKTGDTLAIVVRPYFWQTIWFKILTGIFGAVLLSLVFYFESRRRLRAKIERIARERELERERARIAQDIHDDLGASLTRIGMLSQSAVEDLHDPPRAMLNLNQIYDTARELTRAMDEIVWAVNPRHDTLESLTNYISRFSQDFLSAAQIRCRLDAPTRVPELTVRSEIRHNLFLAFKETLNNAVKHSGASEALVKLELAPGGFKVLVSDNGAGFDPKQTGSVPVGGRLVSGYGVAGIRKRLEHVGGRVEIQSVRGKGTQVELFVPLAGLGRSLE